MRFDRIGLRSAVVAVALASAGAAARADDATGLWIDHTGRGAVEITDGGGKLCGRVAWVDDAKNADQYGKEIIGNVKSVGKNKWDNGWIYDPDRDSKYDVELTLVGTDKLKVMGYAGSKWLSETYTWKRAPADLKKCGDTGDSAAATTAPASKDEPEKTAKADDSRREPAASSNDDVQLDAVKPETDKGAAAKSEPKDEETATAEPEDDSSADEPKGRKKNAGKVLARIMDELGNGDGPIKVKRTGKTCKVTVPYVDMVVSVPCDEK